jgi:hypothetical protein
LAVALILFLPFYVSLHREETSREQDHLLGVENVEMEIYENGSVEYGDGYVPLHRVKVAFDLVDQGPEGSANVIVTLSYHNKTFSRSFLTKHQAAPSQEFHLYLNGSSHLVEEKFGRISRLPRRYGEYLYLTHTPVRTPLEADFDIGHLAPTIHDGDTHLSTLVVEVTAARTP